MADFTEAHKIARRVKLWCPCPYSTAGSKHTVVEYQGQFVCMSCDAVWGYDGEFRGVVKGIGLSVYGSSTLDTGNSDVVVETSNGYSKKGAPIYNRRLQLY